MNGCCTRDGKQVLWRLTGMSRSVVTQETNEMTVRLRTDLINKWDSDI